jgi:NIMA (never in mitosis gene a)-related kinase
LGASDDHIDESSVASSGCRHDEALREAEVLKSLRHPNIIGYDDAFLANSHLCIVMEYADGGDLAAAIEGRRQANRRYHEREAMAIFAQIALALRYVHERRIMHRDVKCQNVFLTSSGVVKLGDFGVAKVLEASEICAATRIGTPHCVPPELCENHPYDFKADVWCLGVVFYQLLALECPFSGASFAALAVRICTAEPRPVPTIYSPEARALLSRLLAKKAEDRPSSVSILAMPHVRRSVAALQRQPCRLAAFGGEPLPDSEASSPLRMLRRKVATGLRRAKTTPEVSSPDLFAQLRRDTALQKPSSSPQKARNHSSPRKLRMARGSKSPKKGRAALATPILVDFEDIDMDARTSPGSRGSVSDLLAAFLLESPAGGNSNAQQERTKSSHSEGAETASTRDGSGSSRRSEVTIVESDYGGLGLHEGRLEDNATCTMLLRALEKEFGLA